MHVELSASKHFRTACMHSTQTIRGWTTYFKTLFQQAVTTCLQNWNKLRTARCFGGGDLWPGKEFDEWLRMANRITGSRQTEISAPFELKLCKLENLNKKNYFAGWLWNRSRQFEFVDYEGQAGRINWLKSYKIIESCKARPESLETVRRFLGEFAASTT